MTPINQSENSTSTGAATKASATSTDELAIFDQSATSSRNGHTTDLVRLYLQDIGRVPLLERDEELTEARKVQNYIELLEVRKTHAEGGDEVLTEFLEYIIVRDRSLLN